MNWVIDYLYGLWEFWAIFTLAMFMLGSLWIFFSAVTFVVTAFVLLFIAFAMGIGMLPIWTIYRSTDFLLYEDTL